MVMHCVDFVLFFFKQKTAYEMRISDWSSDVCSSDLLGELLVELLLKLGAGHRLVLAMAMMLGNRHSRYRKHAGGRGQQENFLHPSSPVVASLPADADSLNRRNILYRA